MKPPCADYVRKKVKVCKYLVGGCEKLAQKEYKRRHDNAAKKDFCEKNGLEHGKVVRTRPRRSSRK